MKKQILSLAVVALLAFAVQSCEKKEPKPTEEELTLGNKVDSLKSDIKDVKDSAVAKTEDAAKDAKEVAKKAAEDAKAAAEKGAKKVEGAAKAVKDGTVKTAKEVGAALKK